jgi:hypothetical protein
VVALVVASQSDIVVGVRLFVYGLAVGGVGLWLAQLENAHKSEANLLRARIAESERTRVVERSGILQ